MGERVGKKVGEKAGEKTGEKVGESLGEIDKQNLCPMVNLLKTLGHFKITILKYNGKSIF